MKNKIVTVIFGVCTLFLLLTCAIGLPIYSRWFYYLHLEDMPLERYGYTFTQVKQAFNEMMNYLTMPFYEFATGELAFSESGKAHFVDCKKLFDLNLSVLILSAIGVITILILKKKKLVKLLKIKGFPVYFYAGIFALVLPLVLGGLVMIAPDEAFVVFHKLFFPGKDNWVFDPRYDEIIKVLPFEYFMDCAIFIAVGLIIASTTLIVLGFEKPRSYLKRRKLKKYAKKLGAEEVGFCDLGYAPIKEFPKLHYAVTIGVKLSDGVLQTIEDAPSFVYFQHYRAANALLDNVAFKLSRNIEEQGNTAIPIAASQSLGKDSPYFGVLPHKTAAVLSGLGFVGKSGLFLSKKYGSKVRLATILTDMPLKSELPVIENGCGDCKLCMKTCPAGAIYGEPPTTDGNRNFDAEKCSKYMKEHFQDIGRGSVCGICIKVCPKNKLK